MDELPRNRRLFVYRIGALLAAAAVLAAIAFLLRGRGDAGGAEPLYPNDAMLAWRAATPEQKLATAEMFVAQLRRDGAFGPKTRAALQDPGQARKIADELVAALNAAANRDLSEYVPPTQEIYRTAARVVVLKGWDQ
jgi:hypothetical protein